MTALCVAGLSGSDPAVDGLRAIIAWLLAASAVDLLLMGVLIMRLASPSLLMILLLLSDVWLVVADTLVVAGHAAWDVGACR